LLIYLHSSINSSYLYFRQCLLSVHFQKKKLIAQKEEIDKLKKIISSSKTERKVFQDKFVELKKQHSRLKSKNISEKKLMSNLKETLRSILTETQIDVLMKKKKKVRWTSEDIAIAITIKYFSSKCYAFLRNILRYPLPTLRTIARWAEKINMRQGVLTDVLRLMKIASSSFSETEKLAVLSFDEMSISCVYDFDRKVEEVIGPHSKIQVSLLHNYALGIYL
jgi:predicted RNase H-like nuclease (RuvC/YqgF family)